MEKIKLILEKCKGCFRIRKHRIWVYLTENVIKQINQYYDLSFVLIICPDCKMKILRGEKIEVQNE